MFVYLITNTVNGKRYVGITRGPVSTRWKQHCLSAKFGKTLIAAAIAKHSPVSFRIQTIGHAGTWPELCQAEQAAIIEYGCLAPSGYNLTSGGIETRFHPDVHRRSAKSRAGRKASAEHRAAISAALKGKPKSKEHAAKSGAGHRGKQISAATRLKASAALTGRPKSPDHRAKLAAGLTKRNQSAEHRSCLSKLRKGRPLSDEAKRAAGDAWRAWIAIPENRALVSARIAASNKRRARKNQPDIDHGSASSATSLPPI